MKRLNALQDQAKTAAPAGGAADAAGAGGGFQLAIPYEFRATPLTARKDTPYNSFAHSFAGMTVQFILFAGIDAGILLLLLRQRGIWQRIRAAPVSKAEFILARVLARH